MFYNNEDILKLLNLPNDESLKFDFIELCGYYKKYIF